MAKHRLINCEFVNSSSFKVNVSNRAKLLYYSMFVNADDRGFVDITQNLIDTLEKNDQDFDKKVSLELLENSYNSALSELLDKGYLYEFQDKHNNKVHLIRHWFYHNKYVKGLWTNYMCFLSQVHLDNNEYILGRKPLKESNTNETNINENNEILNELEKEYENTPIKEYDGDDKFLNDLPFPVDEKVFKKGKK